MGHVYCRREEIKLVEDEDGGAQDLFEADARIELINGNEDAHFSILCNGCAAHDLLREHFPHLAPYIRWHLTGVQARPMHYIANAVYWAGFGKYSDYNEKHLKTTIVYGAVEGDENMDLSRAEFTNHLAISKEELIIWLLGRFDALMQAFDQDMKVLFGDQYQITKKEHGDAG